MRDSEMSTKNGIVKRHSLRETPWTAYKNEICFNSDGCLPPKL